MNILQVNTADFGGGAERVAWELFRRYGESGHSSRLAVGEKRSDEPRVIRIPNEQCRSAWARVWRRALRRLAPLEGRVRGLSRLRALTHGIAEPMRWMQVQRGWEDFHFPGTWRLLDLDPAKPDVVHAHNLHGGYFDLRALPWLSRRVPVVVTLHDMWMLTGHCAHAFGCEKWKTGCHHCEDLSVYPAIARDATAFNWKRKRNIYAASRLYVSTPCRWLMDNVEESMLTLGMRGSRIIPHGVDLSVFKPVDRQAVRVRLGIPQDAAVLLFAAYGIRRNIWKDYETMRQAVARLAERFGERRVVFLALGEESPPERIGAATVQFVPFQKSPEDVARYYQAADVYVHAARAETVGLVILEALACGTPAVATAVGGIPEQVKEGATGFLVPVGDSAAMADRVEKLLRDGALCARMREAAAQDALCRFDAGRQAGEYLAWYAEIVDQWKLDAERH